MGQCLIYWCWLAGGPPGLRCFCVQWQAWLAAVVVMVLRVGPCCAGCTRFEQHVPCCLPSLSSACSSCMDKCKACLGINCVHYETANGSLLLLSCLCRLLLQEGRRAQWVAALQGAHSFLHTVPALQATSCFFLRGSSEFDVLGLGWLQTAGSKLHISNCSRP